METIVESLKEAGIPFAYDHFAADGKVYYKINEVRIELYTDSKDLAVEQRLEAVLDKRGIFYAKSETWIDSEKLYEVLYQFEQEGVNNAEEE